MAKSDEPIPITRAGYRKIVEERDRLWKVDRRKVVHEVSEAAALGDRSENAEYIYGKKKLREIDRRLFFLNGRIERFQVVDPATLSGDRVVFGATVTVVDEHGVNKSYQIVGEDEIEVTAGKISHRSPVGRALLGKRVGDEALVRRPAGEVELRVSKIEFR